MPIPTFATFLAKPHVWSCVSLTYLIIFLFFPFETWGYVWKFPASSAINNNGSEKLISYGTLKSSIKFFFFQKSLTQHC